MSKRFTGKSLRTKLCFTDSSRLFFSKIFSKSFNSRVFVVLLYGSLVSLVYVLTFGFKNPLDTETIVQVLFLLIILLGCTYFILLAQVYGSFIMQLDYRTKLTLGFTYVVLVGTWAYIFKVYLRLIFISVLGILFLLKKTIAKNIVFLVSLYSRSLKF